MCPINSKPSFRLTKRSFLRMVEKFSYGHEVPFPEDVLELVFQLQHQEDSSMSSKFDKIASYEEVHHSKRIFPL